MLGLLRRPGPLDNCADPWSYLAQPHSRFAHGFPISPHLHSASQDKAPGEEAFDQRPSLSNAGSQAKSSKIRTTWSLKWSFLAKLSVPKEMTTTLTEFLYNRMSVNLALAATIIYYYMERRDWDAPTDAECKKLEWTSTACFILYSPHFLKTVELKRVVGYPNPLLLTEHYYSLDLKFNPRFKINLEALEQLLGKVREVVLDKLNFEGPSQRETLWIATSALVLVITVLTWLDVRVLVSSWFLQHHYAPTGEMSQQAYPTS
ncbi:hypothetical protein EDB81DRAFT_765839 [Dactylonectria macrodidyma]|uniref:Uncharacterized protein n=1 Tax=Dactylonectria macrodidyma TaxID=307937 RepID=A0A9P9DNQ6_9HYPO|nr:hypothetical protein EDB81DRAFT_765839 [Dactylonectria macrodidyma]